MGANDEGETGYVLQVWVVEGAVNGTWRRTGPLEAGKGLGLRGEEEVFVAAEQVRQCFPCVISFLSVSLRKWVLVSQM